MPRSLYHVPTSPYHVPTSPYHVPLTVPCSPSPYHVPPHHTMFPFTVPCFPYCIMLPTRNTMFPLTIPLFPLTIPCSPSSYHVLPHCTMSPFLVPCSPSPYHVLPPRIMFPLTTPCFPSSYHVPPHHTMSYFAVSIPIHKRRWDVIHELGSKHCFMYIFISTLSDMLSVVLLWKLSLGPSNALFVPCRHDETTHAGLSCGNGHLIPLLTFGSLLVRPAPSHCICYSDVMVYPCQGMHAALEHLVTNGNFIAFPIVQVRAQ